MFNDFKFRGRRRQFRYWRNYLLSASVLAASLSSFAFFADFDFSSSTGVQVSRAENPVPAGADETGSDPAVTEIPAAPVLPPALDGQTFDYTHLGSLEPTFMQFTPQGEAGLTPEPALPVVASLEDDQDGTGQELIASNGEPNDVNQAELSEETDKETFSVLAAMAHAVKIMPEEPSGGSPDPVPLPVPRPAEFRVAAPQVRKAQEAKVATTASLPARAVAAAPVPSGSPSFIHKLFGIRPDTPPEAALSYASLGSSTGDMTPDTKISPGPSVSDKTAIYNISAKVVIMPNGERLEAHSGLGGKMDDPRFVHVRMKGPTPPGTYILREREALFHGVRALRMNPIGGSATIYGRSGILTHTYLLGPNGDSNGCISFKDYDRFLQAYLRGEVKRIVVVTGNGQDQLPRIVNNAGPKSPRT